MADLLTSFKSTLDNNGYVNTFQYDDMTLATTCNEFNEAIDTQSLEKLVQSFPSIPSEYIEFLRINNGAKLFEYYSIELNMNIGGGCYLYSDREIFDHNKNSQIDSYLIIGSLLDGCLLLVRRDVKPNDTHFQNTLLLMDDGGGVSELKMDFLMFLHRYLTAQGASFWEWHNQSMEKYYEDLKKKTDQGGAPRF